MKKIILTLACVLASATVLLAQSVPTKPSVPTTPSAPTSSKPHTNYKHYSDTNKGFWAAVDLGSGIAFTKWGTGIPLDISGVLGYRLNEFFKVGFGFGGRGYLKSEKLRDNTDDAPTMKNWTFPLFLSTRGDFIKREYRVMVPYWRCDVGYAIQDGFFFAPGFGLSFGSGARHKFNLGISYVGQCSKVLDDTLASKNGYINMFQLRLGYEF